MSSPSVQLLTTLFELCKLFDEVFAKFNHPDIYTLAVSFNSAFGEKCVAILRITQGEISQHFDHFKYSF